MHAMRALVMPAAVRRALVAHARRDRPHECCGLLVGSGARVTFAVPARNVDASPATRYRVDPRQQLDLQRVLRNVVPPLAIVGVYHSHPQSDAKPSASDVAEAYDDDWIYVIVGLRAHTAQVRAFRIRGGRARAVPIRSPRIRSGNR
ncbi:MAG TPA: M67 family metallopeptidase [Vicinamibacterales bacterium]|jgi:proteasome lid subunit RPN8/RPN11|nr:M67 family metallopeptidase [Vicinamibacterales bacterium]